uniref:type IX secretion system membrane protein PorP/SprF n=2 Tax=uncultured Tenacibaculum sp. TaxID=174713 RepID=UPI002610BEAE
LIAGYKFNLGKDMVLQPSIMLKAVSNAPMSLDLSSSLTYLDKVTLGVSARLDDSISTFLNFRVNDFTRIGYAFDYTLSNFGQYNSGSHEVMLLFDLKR